MLTNSLAVDRTGVGAHCSLADTRPAASLIFRAYSGTSWQKMRRFPVPPPPSTPSPHLPPRLPPPPSSSEIVQWQTVVSGFAAVCHWRWAAVIYGPCRRPRFASSFQQTAARGLRHGDGGGVGPFNAIKASA